MRFVLSFVSWCLFITASAQRDGEVIAKLNNEIMRNGTAYENLRVLCKQVGARLSGSPEAAEAIKRTAQMMRVAGADTVWLQPCIATHWVINKKDEGAMFVGAKKYPLHILSLGKSEGTKGKTIRGKVMVVNSMDELLMRKDEVKGNIVLINIEMNPEYFRTFRAYGEAGAGRRQGATEAARYGAIAALVRSLASNPDDYPHTGGTWYNDSFPKIPAVAVSTNDANLISAMVLRNSESKAYRTEPVVIELNTDCTMLPPVPSFNVIGEIRGTQFPKEYITVGGHLDSWYPGEGAHDDGAGCVQSIEVLRAFKALDLRPKRTLRAVMFMDEEQGGDGGDEYARAAKRNAEKHVLAIESDNGGFTPRGFSFVGTDAQLKTLRDWGTLFEPYGGHSYDLIGGGQDIGPLHEELATPLAELIPDSQRYFDVHHAATDVFESVSRRELHLGAVHLAGLVWLASEYGL